MHKRQHKKRDGTPLILKLATGYALKTSGLEEEIYNGELATGLSV